MEKKFLSFLSMLFTAALVNAQVGIATPDVTNYRGAFAPAPTRQWTADWTEFDPINKVYPATNVTVNAADSITTNTTWTSNNVYLLNGQVYVSNNATLTIQPGTVIRGATGTNSALIVTRGAKLIADGTPCRPIVFTSNAPAGVGSRVSGQWGGIVILGRARHNLGTNNLIEGLPNTDARNFHGGTDDGDNSGVLNYVRIEFSGFIFSPNNEINGLTMGSVGNGTLISNVQVSYNDDDAFEWFGGSVNARYLVSFRTKDDDFDTDNGFSGLIQYALGVRDPSISDASQSEGFESDNSATGIAGQLPKTSARFYNVTQIGAFRCASNAAASGVSPTTFLFRRGARVRRNSDLKIVNSILMNSWRGLFVDDAVVAPNATQPTSVNYNEDSAVFRSNIIAGDFTTTWTGTNYNGTRSLAYENGVTRTIGTNAHYLNDSINTCSLLVDPWNANANLADFRPNVAGDGALAIAETNLTKGGADITPTIDIDNALFTPNQGYDFVVNIFENNFATTNGTITITIPMPSGWDISVPSTTSGNSDVFGGTLNQNSNWTFVVVPNTSVTITSKPGTIISKGLQAVIGLRATRRGTTSTGTSQSLSLTVSGGGDIDANNNSFVLGFGTSN